VYNGRSNIPEWLTAGVTYLVPKKRENWKSKKLQACDLCVYDIQTYYKELIETEDIKIQ
jgi:hypothetical protein